MATVVEVLAAAQTVATGDESTTPAGMLQAAALAASATGSNPRAATTAAPDDDALPHSLGMPPSHTRGVSAPAAVSSPGTARRSLSSLAALTGAIARQDSTGVANALGAVMPKPGVGIPVETHRRNATSGPTSAVGAAAAAAGVSGSRGGSSPTPSAHPQLLDVASGVILSPMAEVPGCKTRSYHGRLNMHFVRETDNVRELGGTARFLQLIITEAAAVARAQAMALGANALVGYRVNPRESTDRSRRNQAYHVVSVSGDAVTVEPDTA